MHFIQAATKPYVVVSQLSHRQAILSIDTAINCQLHTIKLILTVFTSQLKDSHIDNHNKGTDFIATSKGSWDFHICSRSNAKVFLRIHKPLRSESAYKIQDKNGDALYFIRFATTVLVHFQLPVALQLTLFCPSKQSWLPMWIARHVCL